jgi:hypothetical protein
MASTSVGATTSAESLAHRVKKYKARTFEQVEKLKANKVDNFESLASRCIRVITENFSDRPSLEGIPPKFLPQVTAQLPLDLDIGVSGPHIHDENYWKRACLNKQAWSNPQIAEHGLTWKQLYFEQNLQDELEDFGWDPERKRYDPSSEELDVLLDKIKASQDYVFCLGINQLLSHLDMEQLVQLLPNLTKLALTYGVKQIGMKYERMLFGMKISDATSLAKSVKSSDSLTTVILPRNLLDDDLLRMLMTGLMKNSSITHLDLSHNKITNHGARLLSKLLGTKSVLTSLSLCDNQIHAEGGRYLGRGLRHNESLVDLNLRLNRLTDEGGRMLFDGMRENFSLSRLNLSSNSLSVEATQALCSLLREQSCLLQSLDLSGNDLEEDEATEVLSALQNNTTLTCLDLRVNGARGAPGLSMSSDAVVGIDRIVRRNELEIRQG